MRIVCPTCAAEYEVPASSLRPRRKVRCTNCGGQWVPVQEAPTIAPEPRPADPIAMPQHEDPGLGPLTAMDRLAATAPARPQSSVVLRAAWLATLLLLIGSAAAIVIWRGKVVQLWPPSARVLGVGHPAPFTTGSRDPSTPLAGGRPE